MLNIRLLHFTEPIRIPRAESLQRRGQRRPCEGREGAHPAARLREFLRESWRAALRPFSCSRLRNPPLCCYHCYYIISIIAVVIMGLQGLQSVRCVALSPERRTLLSEPAGLSSVQQTRSRPNS